MIRKILLALSFAFAGVCAFFGTRWLIDNRVSNFTGTAEIYVTPETTVEDIVRQISLSAEILRPSSLSRTFRSKKVQVYKHPGHYVVTEGQTSAYVARMLNNGWQTPVNFTLSGSMRLKGAIATTVSRQLMLDSASVYRAMCDDAFLEKYGFSSQNVFSLFIPDTYQVYWDMSVEDLFAQQKQAYDRFWNGERMKKAGMLGLTPDQVCIVASIVRGESKYTPELPLIAGVYLNRLKKGMKLQADPTVAYCYDYTLNRILRRHLGFESPYNTYKYAGLPPGPICVPTEECIDAVLNPDYGGGNLFFCANSDFSGTHVFARTVAQHNANARRFQSELNRRAAEKRRAEKKS